MGPLSRRGVLILGATGAAAAVGGGFVLWSQLQGVPVTATPTATPAGIATLNPRIDWNPS